MSFLSRVFLDKPRAPAPAWVRAGTAILLFGLLTLLCWAVLAGSTRNWPLVWTYRELFFKGWLLTIGLSAVSLVLSTLLGLLAAFARRSQILIIRYISTGYVEIIRGLPFLVLLLIVFYCIFDKIPMDTRLLAGVVGLSLFSGAYIAEIIRAGIESIGATQWESARAIGLTPAQTYRYVIFPQALKHSLPPLAGQFASLVKDSSLLSVIGIVELTKAAQDINHATYSTLESFLPLGLAYLILTLPISLWTKKLERDLRYET